MSYEDNRPKTDKSLRQGGGVGYSPRVRAAIEVESKITFNIIQQAREAARGEDMRQHIMRYLQHRNEILSKTLVATSVSHAGVARTALELSMKDRAR